MCQLVVSCFCGFVPFGRLCHFVRLCALSQVLFSAARYMPRQQGTSEVLLAFYFITHEVPDILVQGLVLGLHAEADLIHCDVVGIHQAVASGCAYLGEQVTPCSF